MNLDRRRVYSLTAAISFSSASRLVACDLDTLAPVWSTQLPSGARKLITWGTSGLAAWDGESLYLFQDPQ